VSGDQPGASTRWIVAGAAAMALCSAAVHPSSAAAPNPASRSSPDFMGLAGPAPAPRGYLDFCARRPDQCGLQVSGDPAQTQASTDDRRQRLYSQYYWAVAFQQTEQADFPAAPKSGGPSRASMFGGTATVAYAPPAGSANAAAPAGPPEPLAATPSLLATLVSINSRINGAIRYASDQRLYGVDDYWALPLDAGGPRAGDCKDYVLEKRRALVGVGVPASDLSIAIVRTSWGEAHAVLLVSTDQGELVLDSLSYRLLPWRKVNYTWLERQAPGQQLVWVKLPPRGAGS
jgi:predicted transglutaminase-like cysteine proteinase